MTAPRGSSDATLDPPPVERVTFAFGAYTLDTRTKRLLREGAAVPLTTKAFDTLEVLLRAAGQTVSKDDLMKQVWPGTFVQEDTLAQNISVIRRALGETADSPQHILTVPRDGYRFVAPVETFCGEPASGQSVSTLTAGVPQSAPKQRQVRSGRWLILLTLGVASIVVLAALAILWWREAGSKRPTAVPFTFEVFEPDGARFSTSGSVLALSPDGRYLVFVAEGRDGYDHLWIKASGSRESTPLADTQDASQPFWSADGRSIAFFSRGVLRSIDISAGQVRTVCRLSSRGSAVAGSWSSHDVILFGVQGKGLFQVRGSGGDATPLQLQGLGQCPTCLWPFFLPDGQHFLFTVAAAGPNRGIYIGSLDGTTPRHLLDDASSTAYTTDGYLIYASGGALVARRFDPIRGQLGRDTVPVADHVWINAVTARAVFSASNASLLAYSEPVSTRLQWMSRDGKVISNGPEGVFYNFTISRTGRVLASQLDPQVGTYDLWLHDPDGRTPTRLTFDPASDLMPLWSDDGTRAVFARELPRSGWQLYEATVDRSGAERPLLPQPSSDIPQPVIWKESVLYYSIARSGESQRIWSIRTGLADPPTPIAESDPIAVAANGQISVDGRAVAYTENITGVAPHATLFVRPWPSGPGKSQVAQGSSPRWRGDGAELFFIAPSGDLMAVPVRDGVATRPPVTLFPTGAVATSGLAGYPYDVAPDGQRFLVKVPVHRRSIVMVSGWTPAARAGER